MEGLHWGMGWGMWLFPVFIILIIFLFVKRNLREHNGQYGRTPLDILKYRYAKGEISKEQYELMKKDITQ
jgi:putative membrane protein